MDAEFHLRLPASQHESAVHLFTPDLPSVPRLRKAFSLLTSDDVGMGLWICADIVSKYDGRVSVRSSDGREHKGSVFSLFLPL
jgi:hypothetical protein